jgi:protein arginine kinase activator
MLCDICGKKQATVHLTEIIDDQMTELHLCEECAKEKGNQMEKHFDLSDLLAGLADIGGQAGPGAHTEEKIKCPTCGMTYQDFKTIGQLGCPDCYKAFKKNLMPLLKRIHGSTQYFGKMPAVSSAPSGKAQSARAKVVSVAQELQELKTKLQKAVQQEEFEEAARLRDRIRDLEKKNEAR